MQSVWPLSFSLVIFYLFVHVLSDEWTSVGGKDLLLIRLISIASTLVSFFYSGF